jgi:hypothetical protein
MTITNVTKKKLVVCGDSFAVGIGCLNLPDESFGSLLAKELGLDLINLAKGSSSHFSIRLQAIYAIEKINDIDLLILSNTSYNRTEWFATGTPSDVQIKNESVNYHQYPPYGEQSYITRFKHPLVNDSDYTGEMLTENYLGIVDYVETFLNHNRESGYYHRFNTESPEKMRLLYEYYKHIHEDKIKKWYDIGIITLTHILLKNKGIRHIVISDDSECFPYIDPINLCEVSWGKLSLKYPDKLNTYHTSEIGQHVAYTTILNKLHFNGWV